MCEPPPFRELPLGAKEFFQPPKDQIRAFVKPSWELEIGRTTMADRKVLLSLALLIFASPANAGQSLTGHIRDDPSCRQFNDGCSICLVEDGKALCSTPTIACTVTGWVCVDGAGAAKPEAGARTSLPEKF